MILDALIKEDPFLLGDYAATESVPHLDPVTNLAPAHWISTTDAKGFDIDIASI